MECGNLGTHNQLSASPALADNRASYWPSVEGAVTLTARTCVLPPNVK